MIPDAFVRRLGQCRTERELWPLQIHAETFFTPLELAALRGRAQQFPFLVAKWLATFADMAELQVAQPQPYARREIAENIHLFSDETSPAAKHLVLAFRGVIGRFMLPTAVVLEALPAGQCDFVLLSDPTRRHFLNGIGGYAESALELARRLSRDLRFDSYRAVYSVGVSAGGMSALRCAMATGARRGISVCGRFPTFARRLRNGETIAAFDPLCGCIAPPACELVCAYGNHPEDVAAVGRLRSVLTIREIAYPGLDGHNLFSELQKLGMFRSFLASVLDLDLGRAAG